MPPLQDRAFSLKEPSPPKPRRPSAQGCTEVSRHLRDARRWYGAVWRAREPSYRWDAQCTASMLSPEKTHGQCSPAQAQGKDVAQRALLRRRGPGAE
eukprot:scaffold30241_cov28-Tisochrysis_lutea.AAC.10